MNSRRLMGLPLPPITFGSQHSGGHARGSGIDPRHVVRAHFCPPASAAAGSPAEAAPRCRPRCDGAFTASCTVASALAQVGAVQTKPCGNDVFGVAGVAASAVPKRGVRVLHRRGAVAQPATEFAADRAGANIVAGHVAQCRRQRCPGGRASRSAASNSSSRVGMTYLSLQLSQQKSSLSGSASLPSPQ